MVLVQDWFGRLNDPSASGHVRGLCGEEMEFYLVIVQGCIADLRYYTDGCGVSRACGRATAQLAVGATPEQAMRISAGQVLDEVGPVPADHRHCAILAVTALYKALADYLLKP